MVNKFKILIEESNIISLRTACVMDDGNNATFFLDPALNPQPTKNIYKVEYDEWVKASYIYLYRHMRSAEEEESLIKTPHSVGHDIRPMTFDGPAKLKLLWTDSGNSVALFLNGKPWAFFEEVTRKGYTKGILNPGAGNIWDQNLFDKTFEV